MTVQYTQAAMTGSSDPGDKYFYNRDVFTWKFSTQWLAAKRQEDDCDGLWRIHDDLYDLSGWEKHHPGEARRCIFRMNIFTPQVVATGWTSPRARTALRHSRLSMCLESHSQHSESSGSERPQLQDDTDLLFTQTVSSKLSRGKLPKY